MALKLEKYVQITGFIHCLTGLHIGGSKDEIEIGGMDSPVIRHPVTKYPYIPGSSLKGKLRSLLEYKYGKITKEGRPCDCGRIDCPICPIFGPHLQSRQEIEKIDPELKPTRLLVRDSLLNQKSIEEFQPMLADGLLYAEIKAENIIDRNTGRAADKGFRSQERVPAGAEFELNLSLRVFKGDDESKMLAYIQEGLRLLQSDYLGGSGSRGYGQVEIRDLKKDGQPWELA